MQRGQLAFAQESKKHSGWGVAALDLFCLIFNFKAKGKLTAQQSWLQPNAPEVGKRGASHAQAKTVIYTVISVMLASLSQCTPKPIACKQAMSSSHMHHPAFHNKQDTNCQSYVAMLALHHACARMRPNSPTCKLVYWSICTGCWEVCVFTSNICKSRRPPVMGNAHASAACQSTWSACIFDLNSNSFDSLPCPDTSHRAHLLPALKAPGCGMTLRSTRSLSLRIHISDVSTTCAPRRPVKQCSLSLQSSERVSTVISRSRYHKNLCMQPIPIATLESAFLGPKLPGHAAC